MRTVAGHARSTPFSQPTQKYWYKTCESSYTACTCKSLHRSRLHNLVWSLTVEQLSRSLVTTKSTFHSVTNLQVMNSWAKYCSTTSPPSSPCPVWWAAPLWVEDCFCDCCPSSGSKVCLDDSGDCCCCFCCASKACPDDWGNCCCCPSSELMAHCELLQWAEQFQL